MALVFIEEKRELERMASHYKGRRNTLRALNAYINLARAADSLFGRMSAQLELSGLTLGQFGVLEALLHLGPMCQHVIGQKLLRSGGNITLVVDNLEKYGWVKRERQEDDRRKLMVHLTTEGRKLIEQVFPGHAKAIEREMSVLSPQEQERLRVFCRKLGQGREKSHQEQRKKEKQNDTDSTK
jgi:MarR family transcriptional regulator, 2-MHQ and catechol-resistance regulon repressor